ncbi:MAG TPA: DUF3300 domain-containing protein [Dongiaceae bacterium]|nr:DUF3300 domain-containing protein [Dongiaceae bacterium]
MKKFLIIHAAILVLALVSGNVARADGIDQPGFATVETGPDESPFTPDELDEMLAPIALYPDPLIAQILPAATFIDQIDEATRYVRQYGNSARIDDKPWDVSVKAIAHYPDVLFMMDQKYDWSVSLGQAFINQQQDVMDSIQRLRAGAKAVGNLKSTPQQQVVIEENTILIVPAEPEVIYVPRYDSRVVFVESIQPSYGFFDFGTGLTIGAWLNRDCDWRRHRIYYHGWRGGGWIGRTRPHIPVRNNVYINNNYSVININRRVIRHDTNRYREDLRYKARIRREPGAPGTPGGRNVKPRERIENLNIPQNRITPGTHLSSTPSAGEIRVPSPSTIVGTKTAERPDKKDIYRGREVRSGQPPASYTGYGGYGSSRDAARFRERGRISQENVRQSNNQQSTTTPVRTPPPVTRPSDSGGSRQSAPPAERHAPGRAAPARRGDGELR